MARENGPALWFPKRMQLLVLVSWLVPALVATSGCPLYDSNGQLYLFGAKGVATVTGTNETQWNQDATNRPAFDTLNVICIPGFVLNSAYFLNAQSGVVNKLYSFSFASQKWGLPIDLIAAPSFAPGLPPPTDLNTAHAVMDYDTLVVYVFANGGFYRLGDAETTNLMFRTDPLAPFSLPWIPASNNKMPFNGSAYPQPTFAHAWFNFYFFGTPSLAAGEVLGFRIHYGEWGQSPQSVGSDFPPTPGKTTTFSFKWADEFEHDGAPSHVVFVPQDESALYIIDSYVNTTIKIPNKPMLPASSASTRYAASGKTLAYYDPDSGVVRVMDFSWLAQKQPMPAQVQWQTLDLGLVATGSSSGNTTGSASPTTGSKSSALSPV
ncbi:hypothetical protein HDU91_002507, partial [Kappamyces sp. JEL0680]